MKKKIALPVFFVALFFFIVETHAVSAGGIVGVSPGNVDFKKVLRDGYAERYITITVDSEEPVDVSLEARGEIKEWMDFPGNLSISKNNRGRVLLSVRPPSDIPNGNYTGFLRVSTGALSEKVLEGRAMGRVIAVIDVAVTVEITDQEVLECRANNFAVKSAEVGDEIAFSVNILNEGNVRLKPKFTANIWDQEQISLVRNVEFRGKEILPTREETFTFYLPAKGFKPDQYWVEAEVPDCFASDTLTFDVLEEGALKAEGILLKIFSRVWTDVGETIPIIANFKNTGEKSVDAKFKGKITRDGRIIQILESEEVSVPVSEIINFTFFFTPGKPGKYIASGRVFYDKKRTFESSTVINVRPKKIGLKQAFLSLIYVFLIVFIVLLFYKIRKEKRRYIEKLGR